MKKIIIALCLMLFSCILNAQTANIKWGEESKTEMRFGSFVKGSGNDMIKLTFEVSGGMFSKKTMLPVLTRYNEKLEEKVVKRFSADDKTTTYNNLLSVKGKLFLFTNDYDKDSKATNFLCQEINIQTLEAAGSPVQLASFDAVKKSSQEAVNYELSEDSSKILMFGIAPSLKKENQKYYIGVYDTDMKKIWDNTVELPYADKYIDILDRLVTNDGKVGVIIKHYDQEISREAVSKDGSKVPSYKTKILLYSNNDTHPSESIVDIGNRFVQSLQLTEENANSIELFGLYKDNYKGYVSGYFLADIKKTDKSITTKTITAFSEALVQQIKIDKQGSDKEKDPGLDKSFRLANFIRRDDGTKDYVLEYSSEIFHPGYSYYSGGHSTYVPAYWSYDYGDIIDIAIKKSGEILLTRIPKMQSSTDIRTFSNFKVLPYKNELVFFYNDDDDNVDKDLAKRPETLKKFNKCYFIITVVDAKGNVSRSTLFSHKDVDYTAGVRVSQILDKNHVGIYSQKGGGLFSTAKDMEGIIEVK